MNERYDQDRPKGDFQASVARLEKTVQDLVTVARDRFSDRATTFLDETTARLQAELERRRESGSDYGRGPPPADSVPRRLHRDPVNRWIGGVCAGVARYYGVEPWVIRLLAVTGLLFFPSIVFPAYWIAFFVMGRPARDERHQIRGQRRDGRPDRHGRHDHRSPAPELGPRLSPRYSLRNLQADLTEVELRLRRMETHVTSGQYELQRELNRIERDGLAGHR